MWPSHNGVIPNNENAQPIYNHSNNVDKFHKYNIEWKKPDIGAYSIWFHLHKLQKQTTN